MHVAAHDPTPVAVDRDGVDGDLVEKERELLKREAVASGKPEQVVEKIVDGEFAFAPSLEHRRCPGR